MDNTEARLVKTVLFDDKNAFNEIVELYKYRLYSIAYKIFKNSYDADDAVQETFLRVYKNLEKYDDQKKFSSWISCICVRICGDILRKRKKESLTFSLDQSLYIESKISYHDIMAHKGESPELSVLRHENKKIVCDTVESLPEKYRLVIELRYINELSIKEIADTLDIPISTTKTRLFRGRESLGKSLPIQIV